MPLLGDTGQLMTATFATSSLSLAVTEITIGAHTIDMLDVSVLASTGFQKLIASDLKKAGKVKLKFVFVTSATMPVIGAAPETMTVTWPLQTGNAVAANLAGTGVFTDLKLADGKLGEVMFGECEYQHDGDTGPTYTKATTS
jgi:hypothetical protein